MGAAELIRQYLGTREQAMVSLLEIEWTLPLIYMASGVRLALGVVTLLAARNSRSSMRRMRSPA